MGLKISNITNSIIIKSLLLLIVSMLVIVMIGNYVFTQRQMKTTLKLSYDNNETQLQQLANTANNEMEQFASRLSLLAKTSEIQSMDKLTAAGYLKSFNISSLFISGESISLFDRSYNLVCNNSMLGSTKITYPIEFNRISPHRPTISPWFRDTDGTPKRAFGVVVSDRAMGDGRLVSNFSIRRLWKYFSEYKVGQNGILIACNGQGEILYHPDMRTWLDGVHKITELGLGDMNIKQDSDNSIRFVKLDNGKSYLINRTFNPTYDLGLIALQPKTEIDAMVSSVHHVSQIILFSSIIAILLVSLWQILIVCKPLNNLIDHISQITEGNLNIEEFKAKSSQDEIGRLAKVFNQMHATIKRQIQELNAHRDMLEKEVKERTYELEQANKKLDLISRTDELTQLPNRRDMHRTIEKEVDRANRFRKAFSIIFIDIDHFKDVNDTYGHAAGDAVLKSVASTIRSLLRKYDVLARYGGEEFLTLLPETELKDASHVAERFRKQIENQTIFFGGQEIKVTITLGVAQFDSSQGAEKCIQLADKALYEGKEHGRNRVILWTDDKAVESTEKQQA
ncbi:diguanylate cyclase [uncultured Fibrobacter sp.]|uniref:sensor domain-containing diguanylate cyclase n=1 Tax=uncultured Fibrobacter sp. TaxID=261512 RepID=UPI0025D4C0E6|nr:diguanylate cyclase [uncultured Fibrobacter sp.]